MSWKIWPPGLLWAYVILQAVVAVKNCGIWEYLDETSHQCTKCSVCSSPIRSEQIHNTCYHNHVSAWLPGKLVWCFTGDEIPMCPPLKTPTNGTYLCNDGYYVDSTCQLKCDVGTYVDGPSQFLHCEDTGKWDHFQPNCRRIGTGGQPLDIQVAFGVGVIAAVFFVSTLVFVLHWLWRRSTSGGRPVHCPMCGMNMGVDGCRCSSSSSLQDTLDGHMVETDSDVESIVGRIYGEKIPPGVQGSILGSKKNLADGEAWREEDDGGTQVPRKQQMPLQKQDMKPEKPGPSGLGCGDLNQSLQSLAAPGPQPEASEAFNGGWHFGPGNVKFDVVPGYVVRKGESIKFTLKPSENQKLLLAMLEHVATGRTVLMDFEDLEIPEVDESHVGWYRLLAYTENSTRVDQYQFKISFSGQQEQGEQNPPFPGPIARDVYTCENELTPKETESLLSPNHRSSLNHKQPPEEKHILSHGETINIPLSMDDNARQPQSSQEPSNSGVEQQKLINTREPTETGSHMDKSPGSHPLHKKPIEDLIQCVMDVAFKSNVHLPIQEKGGTLPATTPCLQLPNSVYVPPQHVSRTQPALGLYSNTRRGPSEQGSYEREHTTRDCNMKLRELIDNVEAINDLSIIMELDPDTDSFARQWQESNHKIWVIRPRYRGLESITARILQLVCKADPLVSVGSLIAFMVKNNNIHVLQVFKYYHDGCPHCSPIYEMYQVEAKKTDDKDPSKDQRHPGHKYHTADMNACQETLAELLNRIDWAPIHKLAERMESSRDHVDLLCCHLAGMSRDRINVIRYHHQSEMVAHIMHHIRLNHPRIRVASFIKWLCDHAYRENAEDINRKHIKDGRHCAYCDNLLYTC